MPTTVMVRARVTLSHSNLQFDRDTRTHKNIIIVKYVCMKYVCVCVCVCSTEAYGNPTRIDYGTGHEFKFAAFLCCLIKLGVVPQMDAAALVLKVFNRCGMLYCALVHVVGYYIMPKYMWWDIILCLSTCGGILYYA